MIILFKLKDYSYFYDTSLIIGFPFIISHNYKQKYEKKDKILFETYKNCKRLKKHEIHAFYIKLMSFLRNT